MDELSTSDGRADGGCRNGSVPDGEDGQNRDGDAAHDRGGGASRSTGGGASDRVKPSAARSSDVSDAGAELEGEKPWRDEECLRTLYREEGLSTYELAERFGCSRPTVSNWLDRFDIPVRGKQPDPCDLENERLARDLYVEKELSLSEVAEEVGCTVWKVRYWLDEHGIDTREAGGSSFATSELTDEAWLRKQYLESGLSVIEIAAHLNCSSRTVTSWLKKHDISVPWSLPDEVTERLNDEEELHRLYVAEGLDSVDIAEMFDCSQGYVGEKLREFDITNYDMAGEDHPRWRGGEYAYGDGWSEGKRTAVRERDGDECRRCGMTNEQHRRWTGDKLHVHHIRKARNVEEPDERNAMTNLITLCASCHSEAEAMAPDLPGNINE